MNIAKLKNSRFITKEDAEPPIGVTIKGVSKQNVAPEDKPEDYKYCLTFEELDKPLVLNTTNGQLIAKALGSEETDAWTGQKICLYHEPNVNFGGKLIGGIRARKFNGEVAPEGDEPF